MWTGLSNGDMTENNSLDNVEIFSKNATWWPFLMSKNATALSGTRDHGYLQSSLSPVVFLHYCADLKNIWQLWQHRWWCIWKHNNSIFSGIFWDVIMHVSAQDMVQDMSISFSEMTNLASYPSSLPGSSFLSWQRNRQGSHGGVLPPV